MQYKMQATVVGLQRAKGDGTIEGKALTWDKTTCFVHVDLNDTKGNARGQSTQSFVIGKSDEFDKLAKISLPCVFEFAIRKVTNGKGVVQDEVISYTPLPTEVKSAKAA
jgi:hypothetical protein